MEENQEIKQSYLRKEILEKNYDANLFLEFLITKKGEIASDINNWTIEELKVVVSEFKKKSKRIPKRKYTHKFHSRRPSPSRKSNLENKYNSFNTFL